MYSGAALHLCPGVCVQLHCVLVRWLGAQCWYALLRFSSVSLRMSIRAVGISLQSVACCCVSDVAQSFACQQR